MKLKQVLSLGFGLVVLGALGIQAVPVDRSNPAVTMDVPAPDLVKEVLRRSCYDCHSNETVWPWYAYVAPISWRVSGHVDHGRHEMNFSEWDKYSDSDRRHYIEECVEMVENGLMPLDDYLRMHPDAELNAEEIEAIKTWASLAGMGGGGEGHDEEHDD